ncbi:hypothetical protein ES703_20553 [subsurface metagenome]
MMNQHNKAIVYIIVAALFLAINGYSNDPTIIPPGIEPVFHAITWIATAGSLFFGFVNYIANFGHDWVNNNIVRPLSWRVNAFTYACSEKPIADIQTRLEELIEAKKRNKKLWDQFL